MEKEELPGEDEFEEGIMSVEAEVEKEKEEESKDKVAVVAKKQLQQSEPINETYEAFVQQSRCGLNNTLTGELIEGFDEKKDQGHILAYKEILNKINKIAISLGV